MSSNFYFHGLSSESHALFCKLHYFDNAGPIIISLPKAGLEHMCGRVLSEGEIETILLAHEKELYPLIDIICHKQGGFTESLWESGAKFRRMDIDLAEIKASGIHLSTSVLEMVQTAGFANPLTGQVSRSHSS